MPLPATVKCMWIFVKTLGSFSARSLVSLTLQRSTLMAAALQYEHDIRQCIRPVPASNGLHRPGREVLSAVLGLCGIRRAIHHQDMAAARLGDEAHRRSRAGVAGPTYCAFHGFQLERSSRDVGQKCTHDVHLCVGKASLACCNATNSRYTLFHCTSTYVHPVVSSTLPIGGFSPEPQGSGLFLTGQADASARPMIAASVLPDPAPHPRRLPQARS